MRRHKLQSVVTVLGNRLLLLAVATVIVYLTSATISRSYQLYQLKREEARLRADIGTQRARQETLLREKAGVSSDAFVEKVAREELNLIKPGETAVIILSPQLPLASEQEREATSVSRSNWRRWWDLFFRGPGAS